MKRFDNNRDYCHYQVIVIKRWCRRYHLTEKDFVALEATKFEKHRK